MSLKDELKEDSPWFFLQNKIEWDRARARELYGGGENTE